MRTTVVWQVGPSEACTAVGWSLAGELYSCSDDNQIRKWNMNGESIAKIVELECAYTVICFLPITNNKRGTASDQFVVACTDGCFRFVNPVTKRVERQQEAHQGAIVSCAWNWDGTALVTGGEEGVVKLWSQSGMLRQTLVETKHCVHGVAWSPENDQLLITCGRELIIKPLQSTTKQLQWRAHDGVVLCVDWNPVTDRIVSGGEDCRYKIWDSYGRPLFASTPLDNPVTSVAFSPDGEMFGVGSFNVLLVCDKTGWLHCRSQDETGNAGSVLSLAWTSDCTQLACGSGSGKVGFAQLVDRRVEYKNLSVNQTESTKVTVRNVETENMEDIERPDKIIKISVGYGYIILATSTQCCLYSVENLTAPSVVFDVKDKINLICQSDKIFLLMDNFTGLQLFQYDGKQLPTLKLNSTRTEFLNYQSVSLSPDTVILKDTFNPKCIQVHQIQQPGSAATTISHQMEITEIALSQYGPAAERKVALIDRNRDLWLCSVYSKDPPAKLSTMVASLKWNDYSEVLVAISDGQLVVWYYPSVVFIDRDLLPRVREIRSEVDFGGHDQLLDFFGSRCTVRRGLDGANLTFAVRPYPMMLFGNVQRNDWNSAVRLCRFVKSDALWSILAALAIKNQEVATAEIAYAAIDEPYKVQEVKYIADIPSPEGKNAELLNFQRKPDEAEKILLQAGLTHRAIQMRMRLFEWGKAMEISKKHNYKSLAIILAHRKKFLENFNKAESLPCYLDPEVANLELPTEWDEIHALMEKEMEEEKKKAGVA